MKSTEVIRMATWLYKDGEEVLVEGLEVEPHLICGWSVEKSPKPKPAQKQKVAQKAVPKAADIPTLKKEA
jgi:hypothetical protein